MNGFAASSASRLNLAVFTAALLCMLVYLPGLQGAFIFDDWPNIQNNPLIQISDISLNSLIHAATSTSSGSLGRPVSMISFALNYRVVGLDPYGFKLINLLIHISVGFALWLLGKTLLSAMSQRGSLAISEGQIFWSALLAATLWMLHPLNLTAVLYVVQRMTSLSALFTILALLAYCRGRVKQMEGGKGLGEMAAAFLVFMPLAAFSKESGLLIPAYCAAIELTVFRFAAASPTVTRTIKGVYWAGVALALCILGVEFEGIVAGYANREFTLPERLLTEARVIWLYLKLIVVPNIGEMTLYHDDFEISKGLFQPITTVFALLGVIALLATAFWNLQRRPLLSFAVLFFFAGHLMESTIIALELVFEHRNYLAIYGLLLPASVVLVSSGANKLSLKGRYLAALLLVAAVGGLTLWRATLWGQPFELLKHTLQHHPDSARANMWAGDTYMQIAERVKPEDQTVYLRRAQGLYSKAGLLNPALCSAPLEAVKLDGRLAAETDLTVLEGVYDCLATRPVHAGTVNALVDLANELVNGDVEMTPNVARSMFTAALSNPKLGGRPRAFLLSAQGRYLGAVLHDFEGAQNAFQTAVQADSADAGLWLSYARILSRSGQPKKAIWALEKAAVVDRGDLKSTISALQTDLRDL